MRKTFVWAVAATLMATAAFAGPSSSRFAIAPNATFATGAPATTNNDDSCDITVSPAATLLLPYFEVDYRAASTEALNTVFTITNTTDQPQVAHVTIWTDWSFPVIDFNLFLTGYDVVPVSMYDILGRGVVPATGTTVSPRGARSLSNTNGNPNWGATSLTSHPSVTCVSLPGPIPQNFLDAIRSALTTGIYNIAGTNVGCGSVQVGGVHNNAIGYVTIDVSNTCSTTLPTSPTYYTSEILFDNVFIGDYQRINPAAATGNYAGGSPLVHIKAIPEGGLAGLPAAGTVAPGQGASNLPYTFYDRYTDPLLGPNDVDRRQPLPGVFAARYIQGGTGNFNTRLALWREGTSDFAETANCDVSENRAIPFIEIVRFDEQENPTVSPVTTCPFSPCPGFTPLTTPETSAPSVADTNVFPADATATNDLGGWMYMNLNNNQGTNTTDPAPYDPIRLTGGALAGVSQNWVQVQMSAEGRYAVDFDAAYMGNGCSPAPPVTATTAATPIHAPGNNLLPVPHIEPLRNVNP